MMVRFERASKVGEADRHVPDPRREEIIFLKNHVRIDQRDHRRKDTKNLNFITSLGDLRQISQLYCLAGRRVGSHVDGSTAIGSKIGLSGGLYRAVLGKKMRTFLY